MRLEATCRGTTKNAKLPFMFAFDAEVPLQDCIFNNMGLEQIFVSMFYQVFKICFMF